MKAVKSFPGRLFSCWFATCLPLDTCAAMWFLVLCLALSLAGTGKTAGKVWEGGWPWLSCSLYPRPPPNII